MDCVRRRGKTYCLVISVPADLRPLIGKHQIWRSLKTKNYTVARSLSRKLLSSMDDYFTRIRITMDSKLVNAVVADFGLDLLRLHDELRLGTKEVPPHFDEEQATNLEEIKKFYTTASKSESGRKILEVSAKKMVDRIQEKIFSNSPSELPFVSGAFRFFLEKHGIAVPPPDSKDAKELTAALAQTAKLAHIIEQERVQGIREESELQHRIVSKWQADLPVQKDPEMPISELFQLYLVDWEKSYLTKNPTANPYRIKRKKEAIKIIQTSMIDYFCRDFGLKEIDYDKAVGWRDFHQEDNDLANSSVNKYLEHMSAVLKWSMDRQRKYAEYNPFEKIRLPEGAEREKTRVFTPHELQQYIDLLADTYSPDFPEQVWLPLIILYGGMRNNEIAQLYVDDIQEQDGIPFFRITDDAARKQRVKSEPSRRLLPIHPKLIELGVMEYVQKIKESGNMQLFPNCIYNERIGVYFNANLSARLNALVDCISDDKRLRVYSLRANFKTSIENKFADAAIDLMEKGVSTLDLGGLEKFLDRAFDDVMGHSVKGSKGDIVYRKVQLRLMARVVEQAEYALEFSRLKRVLKVKL